MTTSISTSFLRAVVIESFVIDNLSSSLAFGGIFLSRAHVLRMVLIGRDKIRLDTTILQKFCVLCGNCCNPFISPYLSQPSRPPRYCQNSTSIAFQPWIFLAKVHPD